MTILSQELSDIRTHTAEYLTTTCTILRVTRTVDTVGGWSESWGTAESSVACRLAPAGGAVISILGEHPDRAHFYVFNVAYDVELTAADRVVVDSLTYKVRHSVDNTGTWRSVRQYIVEQEAEVITAAVVTDDATCLGTQLWFDCMNNSAHIATVGL
jgi:hypothetical protein